MKSVGIRSCSGPHFPAYGLSVFAHFSRSVLFNPKKIVHFFANSKQVFLVNLVKTAAKNWLKDTSKVKICFSGVNLFHVDGKGEVSPWTSPCALEIFQILKQGFGTYLGLTLPASTPQNVCGVGA